MRIESNRKVCQSNRLRLGVLDMDEFTEPSMEPPCWCTSKDTKMAAVK